MVIKNQLVYYSRGPYEHSELHSSSFISANDKTRSNSARPCIVLAPPLTRRPCLRPTVVSPRPPTGNFFLRLPPAPRGGKRSLGFRSLTCGFRIFFAGLGVEAWTTSSSAPPPPSPRLSPPPSPHHRRRGCTRLRFQTHPLVRPRHHRSLARRCPTPPKRGRGSAWSYQRLSSP